MEGLIIMDYFDLLKEACDNIGVSFDRDKYNKFILYMNLIKEGNEKTNLTTIIEDDDIIKKHFIDSLKALKFNGFNQYAKVIDVGTGAGLPGIPLKIVRPDLEITLLDSLNKRVKFLDDVIVKLNLAGIKAIHGRAEDYAKLKDYREKYDICVSRAVANLAVLSEFCIPFVKKEGYFISLKGPSVDIEIENGLKAIKVLGGKLIEVVQVNVEDTNLKHNIVIVQKVKMTHPDYPRKAGTASRNPI